MSGEDIKQIIVMRSDLGMRKGKMCAQAAHASLGAVLPYLTEISDPYDQIRRDHERKIEEWLAGPFKKICVRADSEEQLLAIHQAAKDAGLIECLITDSGLTEFNGVPTITCCAIGPDTDEALDPITGELMLL
jgi:PTH2 family peptidyl-tRNA hydrolase